MRQFFASFVEILEVTLIALGAVFLIRTFLVQPFLVSGASMAPTFLNGDYLLIDEITYRFRSPERGEVVVLRYPKDESTYFIKRLIGLPDERVAFSDGRIQVTGPESAKGTFLEESYLSGETQTVARRGGNADFTLGENEYLVLGDNRSYSFDSRDWGVLERNDIVGLVRLRLWPPSGFTVFAAPHYSQ